MKFISVLSLFYVLSITIAEGLKIQKEIQNEPESDESDVCRGIEKADNIEKWKDKRFKEPYSQHGQDERVEKLLPSTGFYVESGAANGVTHSNTLFYEEKGWEGLLVEPGTTNFRSVVAHRKAYAVNAGLSLDGKLGSLKFSEADCSKKSPSQGECSKTSLAKGIPVKAIPLELLLACVNRSTVDFWSLDVEGVESKILESFPFAKIEVGVLLVEIDIQRFGERRRKKIGDILAKNGFKMCGQTKRNSQMQDGIYVNPSYYAKRGLKAPESC